MALEFGIVDLNAPGSTGTQNVTLSGFGVPDAVIAIRANSGGGWSTQASLAVGFWDGTTQGCFSSNTASGTSSTWSARGQSTSHIIAVGAPTSESTQAITEYARVTGTTTDGVTLTWDVTSSAVVRYIFIKGVSSATVGVGSLTTSSTTTDITVGHEPHIVFITTVGDSVAPESVQTSKVQSFGVANYDGTSTNQFMVGYASQDGVTTSNLGNIFRNNACVGQTIWTGETWYGSFSRISSTQFRLTTNTASHGDDHFLYLALALSDPTEFAVGTDTTPSTATTDSVSGLGFEPAFLGIAMAGNTSANAASTTTNNRFCLGITDGTSSHVAAEAEKDNNSSSSVANSYEADTLVSLPDGNGTSTLTHVGALSSFDSDGFTLSYSAANAAVYYGWFAVKAAGGGGVSGTGTLSSSTSAVSGTGTVTRTGTGALSSQASAIAGTGTVSGAVTGTGDLSSQTSAIAGAGSVARVGTGALSAQASAISATGAISKTGTGALESQASAVTGTGTVSAAGTHTGTGAIAAQVSVVAGTGAVTRTALGALIAQSAIVVGAGSVTRVGTGALSSQASAVAGTGTVTTPSVITGTGSLECSSASIDGYDTQQIWTEIPSVSTVWTEV